MTTSPSWRKGKVWPFLDGTEIVENRSGNFDSNPASTAVVLGTRTSAGTAEGESIIVTSGAVAAFSYRR